MSKIVVVFGATGNQGGSVVDSILADPEAKSQFKVRGVTRDTTSEKAKKLEARGVEPVKADLDDPESLKAALKGAYAAFAVTDYWATMSKEKEAQQGKNIADAAKAVGLQHLIYSSVDNVTKATNGAFDHVDHFDAKAIVEEYIRSLGIPASFFQPGAYMTNFTIGQMLNKDAESGKYKIYLPLPATTPIPVFDAAGDTGKFVKAHLLNRDAVLGKSLPAATAYLTVNEIVELLTKTFPNTKGFEFIQVPRDGYKATLASYGMPDNAAEDLTQMFEFIGAHGYFLGRSLEPGQKILKEKPTSLEDFVKASPANKDLN